MKEKCFRCGRETEYEVSTPVTVRNYFIEGFGQLCEECFYTLYPVPVASVSKLGSEDEKTSDDDYSK